MKNNMVIFDLDGCLADDRRRRPYLPENPTTGEDWDAYHAGCGADPVANGEVVARADRLGAALVFITARPERYREDTDLWIQRWLRPQWAYRLLMRPDGDMTPSPELKVALFREAGLSWEGVAAAYDDREDVLAAYAAQGVARCERLTVEPRGPAEALEGMARTFRERAAVYGATYERFGEVAAALWPDGLPAAGAEEWARRGVLLQITHKLLRYVDVPGGHRDSAHDLGTYGAILEALTTEESTQ